MSDTSPRPAPPARADELVETGNLAENPLGAAPQSSDQSTVTNARAPTVPNTNLVPDIPGYAILEKIGEGGMGAVFLATDSRLGRKVALKTMKPALALEPLNRERFFREAATAAAVEHDHIVPVLHIGEAADGTPFIAMPFLQGEPLDARLKREPRAPLALILKVASEVAAGLAAAHAAGLVHRDIKPGNVWLEGDLSSADPAQQVRRCKVLDFGLARSVNKGDAQLTASGAILGTPAFMAPEQARGEKVDHRADLFSLGATLYRMATGDVPFRGDSAMSVLVALATENPPPVRERAADLPPELLALVERLMSKAPSARPHCATEVASEVAVIGRLIAVRSPEDIQRPRGPIPDARAHARTAPVREAPRTVRARVTDLAGAVALVPLVTAGISACLLAVDPLAPWELLARAFLLSTALAWAVMFVSLVPARAGWQRWGRYAFQFVVGASTSALALWCDGWELPAEWRAAGATAGWQYALYFGLAVCACRWWYERVCAIGSDGWQAVRPSWAQWWRLVLPPVMLVVMLIAWPREHAPLELAVLIPCAALGAQAVRPLLRGRIAF